MTSGTKLTLGTLLPFAVLVTVGAWLGLGGDADEPARPPPLSREARAPAGRGPAAPSAPRPEASAPATGARRAATAPPEADLSAAVRDRRPHTPREAVARLLDDCFRDAQDSYPGPQQVVLSFEVGERSLRAAQVTASTVSDPRVTACFVDAVEEARWDGPSRESGRITLAHAFGGDGGRE